MLHIQNIKGVQSTKMWTPFIVNQKDSKSEEKKL